jgi:APA family basic amino acid/polyamine antiporter
LGRGGLALLLQAAALMFVAYTGYRRIATLGEEVRDPAHTIPWAIGATLVVTMLLYVAVAGAAVGTAGAPSLAASVGRETAPLEVAARAFPWRGAPVVLAIGAITAMLGVLLNLILGLSRVLLAMGRRGDMPKAVTPVSERTGTPVVAVVVMGAIIAGLALLGEVRLTWSLSAFTVLIYYSITNLAALLLPAEMRLFPRWISALGMVGCLALAAFVPLRFLLVAPLVIAAALAWHAVARLIHQKAFGSSEGCPGRRGREHASPWRPSSSC